MKHLKGMLFLVVIVLVGLQFSGCSKMPSAPTADVTRVDDDGIGADQIAAIQELPYDGFKIIKSWSTTKKIKYRKGGWIGKRNAAFLYIPPYSMSTERDTRIYAQADLTSNRELLFTFAPEGLKFKQSATLVIDFKDINTDLVSLQWWDGSNWVKVSDSEDASSKFVWNKRDRVVTFDIDHFSIYLITRD